MVVLRLGTEHNPDFYRKYMNLIYPSGMYLPDDVLPRMCLSREIKGGRDSCIIRSQQASINYINIYCFRPPGHGTGFTRFTGSDKDNEIIYFTR